MKGVPVIAKLFRNFLLQNIFLSPGKVLPHTLHRWSIFRSFIYLHLPLKDNTIFSTNGRPLTVHLLRKSPISKSKSESIKHVENLWRRLLDIGLFLKIFKNSSMSRSSCFIEDYDDLRMHLSAEYFLKGLQKISIPKEPLEVLLSTKEVSKTL